MSDIPKHWLKDVTLATGDSICLSKTMLKSTAFKGLSKAGTHILLELYSRITVVSSTSIKKQQKSKNFTATNNGKLVLTYKQVREMFGCSRETISKSFDELCKTGFIEFARSGQGTQRQTNLIALTTNWREYGKPGFEPNKCKLKKKPSYSNEKNLKSKNRTRDKSKNRTRGTPEV